MGGQCLRGSLVLSPSLTFLSWSHQHLPHPTGQFCHQQVGITTLKRQKLLKKESLVNFWDVKAGCVPALWWGRGAGQAGAFAGAMRCRRPAGLHHQARCCHSTSRCLGFSIWKMGGNDIYLPQEGLKGLASMCVEHSNGSWTLLLLYTPVYVTDRLVCGETSTSVSTRHNYTACNIIKRSIFPLKVKKKISIVGTAYNYYSLKQQMKNIVVNKTKAFASGSLWNVFFCLLGGIWLGTKLEQILKYDIENVFHFSSLLVSKRLHGQ